MVGLAAMLNAHLIYEILEVCLEHVDIDMRTAEALRHEALGLLDGPVRNLFQPVLVGFRLLRELRQRRGEHDGQRGEHTDRDHKREEHGDRPWQSARALGALAAQGIDQRRQQVLERHRHVERDEDVLEKVHSTSHDGECEDHE